MQLYDREAGLITADAIAMLAGVDAETIRQHIPDESTGPGGHSPALLPAPLIQRMLANADRLDPNREIGLYGLIDRLAAETAR